MAWRQRYLSLIIVYDLDNPRKRYMDYIAEKITEKEAEKWAEHIARRFHIKRYGYVLYHKVYGEQQKTL